MLPARVPGTEKHMFYDTCPDLIVVRCPTECTLIQSDGPWQCTVTLRFHTDTSGQPVSPVRNILFGETIFTKAAVEDRLRRAQQAILNMDLDAVNVETFLSGSLTDSLTVSFSRNVIVLQICGSDVVDLSLVDLPG